MHIQFGFYNVGRLVKDILKRMVRNDAAADEIS